MSASDDSQRIDRWLWCARFFKTRGLAAEAVSGGKVHVDGQRVKPARPVRPGSVLDIRRGTELFQVTVQALAARRGPASEARTLYDETEASVARRAFEEEARRLARESTPSPPPTRPGKRDRRQLAQLKQGPSED